MKSGRKVKLSDGTVIHTATNGDGVHYMDCDRWPKAREYDVDATPCEDGTYLVRLGGAAVGSSKLLSDACRMAHEYVLVTELIQPST